MGLNRGAWAGGERKQAPSLPVMAKVPTQVCRTASLSWHNFQQAAQEVGRCPCGSHSRPAWAGSRSWLALGLSLNLPLPQCPRLLNGRNETCAFPGCEDKKGYHSVSGTEEAHCLQSTKMS